MHRRTALLIGALFASPIVRADPPAGTTTLTGKQKKFIIPREALRDLGVSNSGAFATDRITVDGEGVGYMYREAPEHTCDSGWNFFSGDEDQAYVDDARHLEIYAVNTVANYDHDIIPYLDTPAPCAFEKIPGTNKFKCVPPPSGQEL